MSKDPEFEKYWRVMRRKFRFKGCLHPDTKKCAGKIISAHSIQKERYLRNIAEDGNVMMMRDNGDEFSNFKPIGLKQATVFNGFCKHHDQTVFASIEDRDYDKFSKRQCFLLSYRAFAREYCAKQFYLAVTEATLKHVTGTSLVPRNNVLGRRDMMVNKQIFDQALLTKNHSDFIFYQRAIKGWWPLALSGYATLDRDLIGTLLFNTNTMLSIAPSICLSVLPSKGFLTVVVSHFTKDGLTFSKMIDEIFAMNDERFLTVLSYWTFTFAENWAVSPELCRRLSENRKKVMGKYFHETVGLSSDYLDFINRIGSLFEFKT